MSKIFGIQPTTFLEIIIRLVLFVLFFKLEDVSPFVRKIHYDELWLYKNPHTPSYISTNILWVVVFFIPSVAFLLYFYFKKAKMEFTQCFLAYSLAIGLNGLLTDIIKLSVGRPRPDFFYRCFPDGKADIEEDSVFDIAALCTGDTKVINNGRKSFPSGHSSFSFCGLGFLSLWLCGKLKAFSHQRGESWRLVLSTLPLIIALAIALSRTCDYHHHWQDVLVGSLLGFFVSYTCYRQYYPRLTSQYSHLPYILLPSKSSRIDMDEDPLLDCKHLKAKEGHEKDLHLQDVKWI